MKVAIVLLLALAVVASFVTSSIVHPQDNVRYITPRNVYQANTLDSENGVVLSNGSLALPHRRSKRFIFTAIAAITAAVTIGTTIAGAVAGSKAQVLQRQAAEQAARHYREQNQLKLIEICSGICVTEWTAWSSCTKQCGGGIMDRTRQLQTVGRCSQLEKFQCPYENNTKQSAPCNDICPNGGVISDDGCGCKKGFKGKCCNEESVCHFPGSPRHGSVSKPPGGFPANYLEVIRYSCDDGFTLVGEDFAMCQEDGTWSRDQPTCKIIQCTPEGNNENVILMNQRDQFSFGETLYYDCNVGYKLIGPKTRTCKADFQGKGMLTSYQPRCEAIKCNYLNSPINGRRKGTNFRFGEEVTFSCKKGFTLIGSETVICSETGKWIGNIPKCEQIVCEAPFVPRNGEVTISNQRFGSRAIFNCLPGYLLIGPEVIFCADGGEWNATEPRCKAAMCDDPGTPENGYKEGKVYFYPHNVSFGCFQGFELIGNDEISCLENGGWSGGVPTCQACAFGTYMEDGVCRDCPDNSNTASTSSSSRHQCLCNKGYAGAPGGPCNEITCPKLGAPAFGTISKCGSKLGSRCQYTCNEGFILEKGSSQRVCRGKGDWDGSNPVCSPCPLHTYKSGDMQCTPCPRNSHTKDVAQSLEGCTCDPGYEGPPGGPCKDKNECLPNGGKGPCEDECDNSVGRFSCRCTIPGYDLDADAHNCKVSNQCKNLTKDDAPKHGGLVCKWFHQQNSQYCRAMCNKGYDFPARKNNYETCGPSTAFEWTFRRDDPTAKFEPCIEEQFPGIRVEADSNYFVRTCKDLTEEERTAVKKQFAEVLNKEDICKDTRLTTKQVCNIKDMAIICGRTTRRRKRRGVEEEESSVDFAFNITALSMDISTEQCPDICARFGIRRYCDRYCVPVYKNYLKAVVMIAKRKLSKAFSASNSARMNFVAAQQNFEAVRVSTSGLKIECDPGMKSVKQQCVPCVAGTYYSPRINDCVLCPNGTNQPLFSQEECYTCPQGTYTSSPGSAACTVCPENTWGPQCRHGCSCVNGNCNSVDGTCICSSGWQGDNCDVDIPGCTEGRCFPGVTCTDIPAPGTGFTCGPCPRGYYGNGITCDEL